MIQRNWLKVGNYEKKNQEDPRTNTLTHKCASLNTEQTSILYCR